MTFDETMRALEAAGTEQTRKTWRRHGVKEPMFGVNFSVLGQLKKKIRTDHALARQLWATGNADARNLATMIADPATMTSEELDRWAEDQADAAFSGLIARNVAVRSPFARAKALAWLNSPRAGVAESGWTIVTVGAETPGLFTDDDLLALLKRIEAEIHRAPNMVRHAMNAAVIAIGVRNPACRKAALAVAHRIGKVEVDHGDTACQTPDAIAYIEKVVAQRSAKAAKAAAASKPARRGKLRI